MITSNTELIQFPEGDILFRGGKRVAYSIYCPTWNYYLTSWRKWLNRFGLPKRWLKQEKERLLFESEGIIICSIENYEWIKKNQGL